MNKHLAVVGLAVASLSLAACGSDDNENQPSDSVVPGGVADTTVGGDDTSSTLPAES